MYEKVVHTPQTGWDLTALFHVLQDAAGEASAEYHAGSEDLADIGLMWVVVRYEVLFERPVLPGEDLLIRTWAMPFRHRMSQRNYRITDRDGALVLTAAGIWTIVDRESRKMVDPAEYPLLLNVYYGSSHRIQRPQAGKSGEGKYRTSGGVSCPSGRSGYQCAYEQCTLF